MKNLRLLIVTAALFAVAFSASAQSKLASVDMKKVFNSYYKTKMAQAAIDKDKTDLTKEIKDMSDALNKARADYKQILDQANDQAISADERDKRKQAAADKMKQLQDSKNAIDQFERQAQVTLSEQSQRMRENLLGEIKAAVSVQAKAAGFTLIIDSAAETANATTAVIYSNGENDLTDAVLKQLNVNAPISTTAAPVANTPSSLLSTNTSSGINFR